MKVLFIDIDTLRPDHMGCYGYGRNTTPNIDSIAEQGIRFDNYYTANAPCLPSRACLVTGMFGIKNGVTGHGGTAADRKLTGADRGFRDRIDTGSFHNIFRKAGMYTASVSTFPERHSAWWFNTGFNEMYNEGHGGLESGESVLPYALDWLKRNGTSRKDWFLHVHFWDPHTPYRAPEAYGNPFENDGYVEKGWITEEILKKHIAGVGPHTPQEINMFTDDEDPNYPRHPGRVDDMKGLRRLIDGYDCGISYADYLIGQLFDELKNQGIYDETAVIITSDHGENFGELGIYAEHGTADHACCHIPFVMKWPGVEAGQSDQELHYSLDFVPTAAELLGVEKQEFWDGKSFAPTLMTGEKCGRSSLVLDQMAHVCQRSARFGEWLYMRTYHDGFHLFDKEMLFNLAEDPHEQENVADKYPEICAQGAKIILDWHDDAMMTDIDHTDPLWTVLSENGPFHTWGSYNTYCERLMQTGRREGAEKLIAKYGEDGRIRTS